MANTTAKFLKTIEVLDPNSTELVELTVYVHENGGIFAIDSSYIEQCAIEHDTKPCFTIQDPLNFNKKVDLFD